MKAETIDNILTVVVVLIITVLCFVGYHKSNQRLNRIKELEAEVEYYKNAANPSGEVIDSLKYNISYRDTTIYNITKEYKKDVEIIKNMPDSSVVNLFYELVWAK